MTIHKPSSWRPALLAPLVLGACELAEVAIEPVPDLVVAAVSVVLTIDPLDPNRIDTRAFALVAVSERETPREIPGASVTVVGESGRSLRLREVSDPLATCVTPLELVNGTLTRPPAGSCHVAAMPGAHFAPGERLSLTVELPDGGILRGESRMPGVFTPTGLSLHGGRCRVDPDTVYQFNWAHSAGSWAYIAEARLAGLGDLWPHQESLFLDTTLRRNDEPQLAFPRDLFFRFSTNGNLPACCTRDCRKAPLPRSRSERSTATGPTGSGSAASTWKARSASLQSSATAPACSGPPCAGSWKSSRAQPIRRPPTTTCLSAARRSKTDAQRFLLRGLSGDR